ncbi:uncharacterized protein At4g02000-like [Gossypium arboreum]|uniref:uncharacterized protein At4g02000-like n=1 Tax=Gossypium arboreum TaxID=29729 RepID=UPI000819204F|nr:uncharacterized protein At4g02000-like [Gossypium arboreum]
MEEALANLNLLNEEEEAFQEDVRTVDHVYSLCLVGCCLTDSVVHFPSLRNTLADLWHPIKGICISDLGGKRFLFQFFHEVDIQRVLLGTPWFFNIHLLLLHRIQPGENPLLVPLNLANCWVQIHDLPPGLMTVSMAEQFGNFLGQFLDYDMSFSSKGFHTFMHIKARLEVSKPLKRKKKILILTDRVIYARFQHEKLSLFCFICGKLGHGESFCPFRTSIEPSKIGFGRDITLWAATRRQSVSASKWLQDADGSD